MTHTLDQLKRDLSACHGETLLKYREVGAAQRALSDADAAYHRASTAYHEALDALMAYAADLEPPTPPR